MCEEKFEKRFLRNVTPFARTYENRDWVEIKKMLMSEGEDYLRSCFFKDVFGIDVNTLIDKETLMSETLCEIIYSVKTDANDTRPHEDSKIHNLIYSVDFCNRLSILIKKREKEGSMKRMKGDLEGIFNKFNVNFDTVDKRGNAFAGYQESLIKYLESKLKDRKKIDFMKSEKLVLDEQQRNDLTEVYQMKRERLANKSRSNYILINQEIKYCEIGLRLESDFANLQTSYVKEPIRRTVQGEIEEWDENYSIWRVLSSDA